MKKVKNKSKNQSKNQSEVWEKAVEDSCGRKLWKKQSELRDFN